MRKEPGCPPGGRWGWTEAAGLGSRALPGVVPAGWTYQAEAAEPLLPRAPQKPLSSLSPPNRLVLPGAPRKPDPPAVLSASQPLYPSYPQAPTGLWAACVSGCPLPPGLRTQHQMSLGLFGSAKRSLRLELAETSA